MRLIFVAVSVCAGKDYVWPLLLQHLEALEATDLHIHCLFDHAPDALNKWREWQCRLRPPVKTTETVITSTKPPSAGTRGYGMTTLTYIMGLQEQLRQAFLDTSQQHCLWVECDQIVPPCLARKLLARDKSTVMALTPARIRPEAPNACTAGAHLTSVRLANAMTLRVGELYEMGSVGLGCTLMKRKVLETVGWENPQRLGDMFANGGDVVINRLYWEKSGENPWLDCSVVVPHVDQQGDRLLWHTFEQDREGRMIPKTEVLMLL